MTMPTLPGNPATQLLVDISHNQPNANLVAAKAGGVAAVFLKATEGATYQDPAFLTLFDRAKAAGLLIGAYHFGTARAPSDQVDNYINTVTRIAGGFDNIVAVLDLEHNDGSPDNTISPAQGDAWVEGFKARTGRTPIVYAGAYLRDSGGVAALPNLQACPLWLAQYSTAPVTIPGWADWTLWQFTDGTHGPFTDSIPGIGHCDQDLFRGSAADLAALWAELAPPGAIAGAAV
jgi:lysozyme